MTFYAGLRINMNELVSAMQEVPMSNKRLRSQFAYGLSCRRSQARIRLTIIHQKTESTMKKSSHKKTVERPCLECRLAFRLSAKEKQEIEAKAKLCAMSLSKYIRRCVVGHSPKLHLTEQETEAFGFFPCRRNLNAYHEVLHRAMLRTLILKLHLVSLHVCPPCFYLNVFGKMVEFNNLSHSHSSNVVDGNTSMRNGSCFGYHRLF